MSFDYLPQLVVDESLHSSERDFYLLSNFFFKFVLTHYKLCFRPKVDTDERDAADTKPAQTCESDDDDADDDDAEVDVDFVEDSFVETGLKTSSSTDLVGSGSGSGKSPTHSMRSVLSRPRSAPQRRATISGSSPSHYKPYINITEVSCRYGRGPKGSIRKKPEIL